MKKEFIGTVKAKTNEDWSFETENRSYSADVCTAIDELLGICTEDGERYKITIEKLDE